MKLVERARETIKPIVSSKERDKRRQSELAAIYSAANNLLDGTNNPRYLTSVGGGIAQVDYVNVGKDKYDVAIDTRLLPGYMLPENPSRINIAVKKYYRDSEGKPAESAGFYTISRDGNGRYDFEGTRLPTVPEKKTVIWSRVQRKPLKEILDQLPTATRWDPRTLK